MDNTNNLEPSVSQNVGENLLEQSVEKVADTVTSNEKEEKDVQVSGEISNSKHDEQNAKKCNEEKYDDEKCNEEKCNEEKCNEEKCNEEKSKAAESISTSNNEILQSIDVLSAKMDSLNILFSTKIQHIEYEEKIVDKMHNELQKYKEDMYAQLIKPILLDIIEVRDSILRITDFYLSKPEGERNIPNETFAGYALEIQDILEKNGVETYKSSPGDSFVPVKQRAIKKIITGNNELHGKVAESLSSGYNFNGRTISAEKVSVYFYNEQSKKNE